MRTFNALACGRGRLATLKPIPTASAWRKCRLRSVSHIAIRISASRPQLHQYQLHGLCNVRWRSRTIFTDSLPNVLVPPAVFFSLLVGLWTYKCIMTVLFQDKIIYMPYMPPFARSEKIEDYTAICRPVDWKVFQIRSLDKIKIALAVGRMPQSKSEEGTIHERRKRVVICYFHGNGSSIPPRLPLLSGTLKAIDRRILQETDMNVEFMIVALSYRGYWTSSGRASQKGIEKDAQALLQWVHKTYAAPDVDLQLVLWGQSIGAGVASTAAATYLVNYAAGKPPIAALVLETPFTGIKSMLLALYPQNWLPYKYLWPFLWNHWDSELALRRIATSGRPPHVLLLPATRDEVVPRSEVDKLEAICTELDLQTTRKDVIGALHFEATIRTEGQEAVARFVVDSAKQESV